MLPKSLPFLLILALGCGDDATQRETPKTPAQQQSCLNVINGKATDKYKAISLIVYEQNDGLFTCTGTFVSPNTMITAAHCVPSDANAKLHYIPGNQVNLGTTISQKEDMLATGVEAITFIRGNIVTEDNNQQISTSESPKDLAIAIFPDNTAPAILPLRKSNISGGEKIDLIGFGDTAINQTNSSNIRTKRHGRNNVVDHEALREQLPDLWIVAGRDSTTTTDGSATDSLAAQGDSGGPLLFENTIVGIASAAGPVPQGTGFSQIISADAMNIYASVHSGFADAMIETAKKEGANFEFSDDAETIQQPTTTSEVTPSSDPDCT